MHQAGELFLPEQKGILVKMIPEREHISLHMEWLIPATRPMYKASPAHYLSHLIGDEGKGSVFALLKKLGYALSLSAGESGLSFKNA